MRGARAFVAASGKTSIRGFFGSDAVKYDPSSASLRVNVRKFLGKQVYDLADGATSDEEEEQIRDIMVGCDNSYELVRLFGTMRGWKGLDDELPESYLDPIARRLSQLLDQRDYIPYQMIRRYLLLFDYNAAPTLGDCFEKLLRQWPPEFLPGEIDMILAQKGALLESIARAVLREQDLMKRAATISLATINLCASLPLHRGGELVALMHEVNYTVTICGHLATLDYVNLYGVVLDMAQPPPFPNAQRIACRDSFVRLAPELAATAKAVEIFGTGQNKSTVDRFNTMLKAAIDNFPAAAPNPGLLAAIATTLNGVAGSVADLLTLISNLTGTVIAAINLPNLTGSSGDDTARFMVSELHARNLLGRVPTRVKTMAINAALSGWTVDDDEIAILRVLEQSKILCQAELYQLAAGATWESLDTSIDGDQHDELESLLNTPT